VLGTTGEATSFSLAQRRAVMSAGSRLGAVSFPNDGRQREPQRWRMRRNLPSKPAALGFCGRPSLAAVLLQAGIEAGILRYFERIVEATARQSIGLYLYNFPALAGVAYTPSLVALLRGRFGERILGLKDSSGDVAYARQIAALSPTFDVFPSNEANLLLARGNGPLLDASRPQPISTQPIAPAPYKDGDATALARAVAILICDGSRSCPP